MNVLVINCGSSSIKADILSSLDGTRQLRIRVERIGTDACTVRFGEADPEALGEVDHTSALENFVSSRPSEDDTPLTIGCPGDKTGEGTASKTMGNHSLVSTY